MLPEYLDGILNDMSGLIAVSSRYHDSHNSKWTITAPDDFIVRLFMITVEFVDTQTRDCGSEKSIRLLVSIFKVISLNIFILYVHLRIEITILRLYRVMKNISLV